MTSILHGQWWTLLPRPKYVSFLHFLRQSCTKFSLGTGFERTDYLQCCKRRCCESAGFLREVEEVKPRFAFTDTECA
eukprot:scaffold183803_cov30-Prasinocladus_malaysianus.AAC.1